MTLPFWTFIGHINQLLEILLESEINFKNRYQMFRDKGQKSRKTLMHYAAELGFLHVTKTLVKKCPGLLALMTREPYREKQGLLPVELALLTQNDDVAAYLIRLMSHDRYAYMFLSHFIRWFRSLQHLRWSWVLKDQKIF